MGAGAENTGRQMSTGEYRGWFIAAAEAIFEALPTTAVTRDQEERQQTAQTETRASSLALFYQTDARVRAADSSPEINEQLHSPPIKKFAFLTHAMERFNEKLGSSRIELVFHKYATNVSEVTTFPCEAESGIAELNSAVDVGQVLLQTREALKGGFSHIVCFRKVCSAFHVDSACSETNSFGGKTPAIIPRGPKPIKIKNRQRCMGLNAALEMCRFVKEDSAYSQLTRQEGKPKNASLGMAKRKSNPAFFILDPFCGAGTVLAAANHFGIDAVGTDLSTRRVRQSHALTIGAESFCRCELAKIGIFCKDGGDG